MPQIEIAGRPVGSEAPVFVIAEAGTSHQGSLKKAFELADAARESGADCVKFQYVIAEEIVHPKAGSFPLLGRQVDIFRRFRELEQPLSFYRELKEYCERTGILFLCSPFGPESARNLLTLQPAAVKIASPELNHYPMLGCFCFLHFSIHFLYSALKWLNVSCSPILPAWPAGLPSALPWRMRLSECRAVCGSAQCFCGFSRSCLSSS